ncbi:MAG: hypothetical protein Q9208_006619 [Pyrenodesmia sp. 3 TL-2023]
MPPLTSPTPTSQCLAHLRRLIFPSSSTAPSPFRQVQIRGKKKSAKGPHTVNVRLLDDIKGYGRKGSIIPIAPGRMRNIYYPQRKAEYVTASQMRTLNQKDLVIERDFNFGVEQPVVSPPSTIDPEVKPVDVRMKLLTPKRTRELIEDLVPQEMVFYKTPILAAPEPEAPSPATEPLGNSINAIGGQVPMPVQQRAPEPKNLITKIFGSVSTADMVDTIKAVLAEDEEAARVVLSPGDIVLDEKVDEERGVEADRLKALGEWKVEIRLKGVEPVRRMVSLRAQEMDL